MTRLELIDKIEHGSDIMLDIAGKHFTIITWAKEGIGIGEQYPNCGAMQYFDTAAELVNGFRVNGIPIGDIAAGIHITDYTGV